MIASLQNRLIFEEPTEELERHGPEEGLPGFMLGGMANASFSGLATQYMKAADVLLDQVQARAVWDYEIAYPTLHLLRHALELLLKGCLAPPPHGHDLALLLGALAARLQREHGADLPAIAQARIAEFGRFDPASIAFRYSQIRDNLGKRFGPIPLEVHVDLHHLRRELQPITQGLTGLARALRGGDPAAVLRALAAIDGGE
jgi:hypothetical protein